MTTDELVSVCIPVRNGAAHVREAVESVLNQSHDNFELIVVDNCSTDDTVAILESLGDERLRIVRAETGVDAIQNWIRTCELADGVYLKLLCHDDLIHPEILATQVNALAANSQAVLVATRRQLIDTDGRVLSKSFGLPGMTGEIAGPDAIRRCLSFGTNLLGEPAAVLFRKSSFDRAGTWGHRFPYLVDLEMYFRVLLQGSLVAIPRPLAAFRTHSQSWSSHVRATQGSEARGLIREWSGRDEIKLGAFGKARGLVRATGMPYLRAAANMPAVQSALRRKSKR